MLNLITVTPWTRINDKWADGTIPYAHPDHDITHPLMCHDSGANSTWNGISTRVHGYFYRNIALDLVSETVFNYPYPYISEKTLRPIVNQRMFVIMGGPGILSVLRDRGFKTWGDIIDESYDNIIDPCDRFKAIVRVVRDFCQLPLNDVKQYLRDNQDRLQHNLITLRHLRDRELQTLDQRLRS